MVRKIVGKLTGILAAAALAVSAVLLLLFLLGVRPYVVRSGSMEPAVPTGSLCFINSRIPYEEIETGDIAAYRSVLGKNLMHRVVSVTKEGLETKGDANEHSDGITITRENYMGRGAFWIPGLGYLFSFLQTDRGKILGVTAVLCLVVCSVFLHNDLPEQEKEQKIEQEKLEERG